ncbi:MAG: autotransporter outer membrane beta-barrel domain-containing protein, partial [Variovorax sp.]
MTSGYATQRTDRNRASTAIGFHGRSSGNAPTVALSGVALAVALLAASPQMALAASECGPDAPGADTIVCAGASYGAGITYAPTDGVMLTLNNPGMVVSGSGVGITLTTATSATVALDASSFGSITAGGSSNAIAVRNTGGGLATVTINGGTITSQGTSGAVLASSANGGDAEVFVQSGLISNSVGYGVFAQAGGFGNATAAMSGGTVEAEGGAGLHARAVSGTALVTVSGGTVVSNGLGGAYAQVNGAGHAHVQVSGGTVSGLGNGSTGITARTTGGTYAVEVTGGTVTGGSGFGAGIHTGGTSGTIDIGSGAIVNGGTSGVAIRDGDLNKDGVDETGGNATITTAGTLNGAIVLGGGTDTVTVTGGAINGNITGDGVDALNLDLGTNSFTHGAAYAISGIDGVVMNSGTARLDSTVSANTLTVKGGTLVISNTATFSGPTSVEGGTLAVNGTLNGVVDVLALGRLQGTGTVGNTTVAGTIAPGNSIGTLSVNGNYTQLAGSTYQVEVDPASTASDLLRVSGSATLGAGSQLQVVRIGTANYIVGNRYTVLTASGGVAGTYSLTGDTTSAFGRLVDSYDANNVYLTAEKVRSIADAGSTPNQAAVGTALDSLPTSNSVANAVIWSPNDAAARDALNQLSADIHASTKTALLQDSHFVRDAAIDRLRNAACAPGSAATRT